MGKRRGKQGKKGGAQAPEGAEDEPRFPRPEEYTQPVDPPRAALAVHPAGAAVAVAVGPELRVYDCRTKELKVLVAKPEAQPAAANSGKQKSGGRQQQQQQQQQAPVLRGVAFDAAGRYLLAGSEDKAAGLRLWDCATWELLQSIKVPKKVTTCTFTADGRHLLAGDKFGDVLAAACERPAGLKEGQQQEPETMLGHYCAILTSLSLSHGGRLLATTDRDQKVRVSIVPAEPLAGAHEIQSYCFGHTSFVTCSAFVRAPGGGQELLASGGGDGTLRLWDPLSGRLLHTLELPPLPVAAQAAAETDAQQQEQQQQAEAEAAAETEMAEAGSSDEEGEEEKEDETAAAVAAACEGGADGEACGAREGGGGAAAADVPVPLALAAAPDGSCLVAAVDGRDDLCLISLDWEAQQLREAGWFALPGLHLPACLSFDAGGRLWAAGGPVADDSTAAFLACGSVAAGGEGGQGLALEPAPLPDWLPPEAAKQLEAQTGGEAAAMAAAAERRRLACQLLRKRQYSLQQLEHRKRRRRDKVAAAERAAKEQAVTAAAGAQ